MRRLPGLFLVLVATLHVLRLNGPWWGTVAVMVAGVLVVSLSKDYGQEEQDPAEDGESAAGAQQ